MLQCTNLSPKAHAENSQNVKSAVRIMKSLGFAADWRLTFSLIIPVEIDL